MVYGEDTGSETLTSARFERLRGELRELRSVYEAKHDALVEKLNTAVETISSRLEEKVQEMRSTIADDLDGMQRRFDTYVTSHAVESDKRFADAERRSKEMLQAHADAEIKEHTDHEAVHTAMEKQRQEDTTRAYTVMIILAAAAGVVATVVAAFIIR